MHNYTIGFIGGGRITKILLHGWKRAGNLPTHITVTDTNTVVLEYLKKVFPEIKTVVNNPKLSAECDVIFIGLHPPVVNDTLQAIKAVVKPSSIVISLAPKISIAKISEALPECKNIVRINPNAPSIVNAGYNPIAFSKSIGNTEKKTVIDIFGVLGDCPEVSEELLEAFAMTTAMGPTYLWFQLYQLHELAISFGIPNDILKEAIPKMLDGSVKTMYESGLTPTEVMDLIPVRPLGEDEPAIKGYYQNRLNALYKKLKS
jgi:pyrroline-5-carboxylate reductase